MTQILKENVASYIFLSFSLKLAFPSLSDISEIFSSEQLFTMEVHPFLLNSAESIYSSYITGMRGRLEFSTVIIDTVQYIEVPVRATIFHCFI